MHLDHRFPVSKTDRPIDPKLRLLRRATSQAQFSHSNGGRERKGGHARSVITLPDRPFDWRNFEPLESRGK